MKSLRFCLILLSSFCVLTSPIFAQGNDNPTGPGGGFSGTVTTGGGYDAYTGAVTRTVVDLEVPGAVSSNG